MFWVDMLRLNARVFMKKELSFLCSQSLLLLAVGCTPSASDLETPQAPAVVIDQTGNVEDAVACIFRQRIETIRGDGTAGTAFSAKLPQSDRKVIVTAIHLLGPAGGFSSQVSAVEISNVVETVSIFRIAGDEQEQSFPAMPCQLAGAAPFPESSTNGDVLVFAVPDGTALDAIEFSTEALQLGDPVWLAAHVIGGAPESQFLHQGRFLGIDDDGYFKMEFLNAQLDLRATSGAPIVNKSGHVVAVNLAGMQVEGALCGYGNPVTRFVPGLDEAMPDE